jgi:hypothetical protein
MKVKTILLTCVGFFAVLAVASVLIRSHSQEDAKAEAPSRAENQKELSRKTETPLQEHTSTFASALKETDPVRRKEMLRQWADAMEVGKIEAFLANVESIAGPKWRSEIQQALLSSWAARDLPGLATWFGKREAADEMHQESRDLLIKVLTGVEPDKGLQWIERSLPESVRRELYEPFFLQWARRDPAAAAARLRELAETATGDVLAWNSLIPQVAAEWARTDLGRAFDWASSLPDGATRSQAMVEVSYQWAATDPRGAAAYAEQRYDMALLKAVAGTWAASDPKSAAAWASGLPEAEGQFTAMATASAVWAQEDPAAAAAYVNALPPGEARNRALVAVASAWAYADPPAAARWAEQLLEGPARGGAFERLINAWTVTDPYAAGQWLQHLPATPSRDSAVIAFCSAIDGEDPAVSFAWAGTVSDEVTRNQKLERTATIWLAKDPALARSAIAQSRLPEDIKSQLMAGALPRGNELPARSPFR